ncbi:hypothetical protein MPTK1_7g01230 [Marchantia polymorpha subsp. ruderalis]|uniref:Serine hydrolase domain-containing protein n=2 Tax=Marchantia polymorpha TaxID=3197 RepID=A0AAF6BUZ5_MARPO|nr:hypothetical protein MARPO_0046s0001 [Marchantia polymorpha]BBN15829.1 hypothetical protein Mp_7g01230 [Marchantia polymorpha subsp. ruderalis]|eukprot:PTQ39176.1 hypothetical protein MARPO_0046s0001 [Marchantia polymorpha]
MARPGCCLILTILVLQLSSSFTEGAKLRILAFHPYLSTAEATCASIRTWNSAILNLAEFNCLTAPFTEQGGRSWFLYPNNPNRIEESIAYVIDYMHKTGPYDGVYGFSQGAMMAAYIVAGQEKNMVFAGKSFSGLPRLRFAILHEGGRLEGVIDEVYSTPVKVKTLHSIGKKDARRWLEEEWPQYFVNPTVVRSEMEHTFLTNQNMDAELVSTMVNFLKNS